MLEMESDLKALFIPSGLPFFDHGDDVVENQSASGGVGLGAAAGKAGPLEHGAQHLVERQFQTLPRARHKAERRLGVGGALALHIAKAMRGFRTNEIHLPGM